MPQKHRYLIANGDGTFDVATNATTIGLKPGWLHYQLRDGTIGLARPGKWKQEASNPHAVALGRKGGRVTSDAKTEAARLNGLKGGRPPKPHTAS